MARETEMRAGTPHDVTRWRVRADELRALAERFTSETARSELRGVADAYERMADGAESIWLRRMARTERFAVVPAVLGQLAYRL